MRRSVSCAEKNHARREPVTYFANPGVFPGVFFPLERGASRGCAVRGNRAARAWAGVEHGGGLHNPRCRREGGGGARGRRRWEGSSRRGERAHHPARNATPGWDGTLRELRTAGRDQHEPPSRPMSERKGGGNPPPSRCWPMAMRRSREGQLRKRVGGPARRAAEGAAAVSRQLRVQGSGGSAAPPVRHPHRLARHPPGRRKQPGCRQCNSGVSAPGSLPLALRGRRAGTRFLSIAILRHYIQVDFCCVGGGKKIFLDLELLRKGAFRELEQINSST